MKTAKNNYSSPKINTTVYRGFKGVDMTNPPTEIDKSRSPFAPNLISGNGGFPEKRLGYRTIHYFGGSVNGLFSLATEDGRRNIVHAGEEIYLFEDTGEPVLLKSGVNNGRSFMFAMEGRAYILTGREYLVYGEFGGKYEVKKVSEIAYIPTTTIGKPPAGGGTAYEEVNLLQPKRKNLFLGNGTDKVFQLDGVGIDSVNEVKVNGVAITAYTVNLELGRVTFTTAPSSPSVTGQDNVEITFSKSGEQSKIENCTIATLYGVGSNDRVFVSGNPDEGNTDWYSGLRDPTYFPDLGYSLIGARETRIMGYAKIGQYQCIIKEDNAQDSTIFLRTASMTDSRALFPLKQGVTGTGAASMYSFATLIDEPLFLGRRGIFGITSDLVTAERTVRNRSHYINGQLFEIGNPEEAAAVEWNGYYILSVGGGTCYALDANQPRAYIAKDSTYSYESYHFENVPARCFLSYDGNLYFGTHDGRLCKFNTDIDTMDRFSDDSEPIKSYWSTKADDDGTFMILKTMRKRGCGVMIKPYLRSSVRVLARSEKDFGKELKYSTMDLFGWEDIDFERISFISNDAPQVVPFNRKVKKYLTLQLIVENNSINEGFGVLGLEKRYTLGNFKK